MLMQGGDKMANIPTKNQMLTLENRKHFTLTGVNQVESSTENLVKLSTNLGALSIWGSNLNIDKIDVSTGEFSMNGEVKKLEFKQGTSSGKFSSLFK